jgi:hypothetical protein
MKDAYLPRGMSTEHNKTKPLKINLILSVFGYVLTFKNI